ncbi:hypothetical protein [Nocardioides euryhalodurans]|uniref:PH domain-containing protein n=1 Tax=Nocardioides euryhalodurans TaxID=2518370 RepID=A0A4V1BEB7_9ACTN|nr:hypothetical protein [Nocardioides euryhalodurans]QBR94062.1 hypothetical protein EXE57_18555 [Nocardioides euryhalodurans]
MSEPPGAPAQLVVRYQRGLGVAALVGGALLLVLGLGTGDVLNIVLGLILGGLGLGYALGAAVVWTATELQLKSPLGTTTRRYPVAGPADLRIDGNTLVHTPSGKKVVSLGFGLDRGDVARLREAVGGPGDGRPPSSSA